MTADAVPLDRRQRRRQETIEEVLDIAVEIMTEQGVAGLSIGEVARRMGIRPPSLYVYFPSKEAIYDAVFHRGAQGVLEHIRERTAHLETHDGSLHEILLIAGEALVRWSVEHPAYTQMLFWRPVPGFIPSAQAYQPAVELVEFSLNQLRALQQRGLIRADADLDDVFRDWTVLGSGIVSQQMSNAPDHTYDQGPFTTRLPALVAMFCQHYGAPTSPSTSSSSSTSTRGTRNARKR